MVAKNKPAISPQAFLKKLSNLMASSDNEVKQFQANHAANPFCNAPLLYALPGELLNAIRDRMPSLLKPDEVAFEQDLATLCLRHHAVGIFHGRPVRYSLLCRPPNPLISENWFLGSGWDRYMTFQELQRGLRACFDLLEPLCERSIAYVGWLLTNPEFLSERDQLRARWEGAIEILGVIPAYPVRAAKDVSKGRPPRHGRDVLREFIADFNSFYERWQVQRMPTWDLPEPCGANLTGEQLPCNHPQSVSRFTIDVPTTLRLPAHFPLQAILEDIQRQQTPEHLRPWLEVQDQLHRDGLRHGRFANMFQLAVYRETALASRYQDRLAGLVKTLDEAFADFLHLGVDSVKKLRLKMAALRTPRA